MRPVAASGPGESASGDRRLRFGSLDFALHFGGVPMLALERASTEDQIAICDQIVLEVAQVLSERLGWETDRVAESLGI